jgi:hypothetical protein
MGKKITFGILALSIIGICCSSNRESDSAGSQDKGLPKPYYDTIFFEKESAQMFECIDSIRGSAITEYYILLESKGAGKGVWIDSILHLDCTKHRLAMIARSPDRSSYQWIYFNGDSVSNEIIAKNAPSVRSYKMDDFTVIVASDDIHNSGNVIRAHLFFKINRTGGIEERLKFFQNLDPTSKTPKDFYLTINEVSRDTLLIVKGIIASKHKEKYYLTK